MMHASRPLRPRTFLVRELGFLAICCGMPCLANAQEVLQSLQSDALYGWFGRTVAGLGDLDGDGVNELIVGEPWFGVGGGGGQSRRGRALVFSGSTGATLYSYTGVNESKTGTSLGDAGDIDGDGTSDFIVGAPGWPSQAFEHGGRAVVYSGATGLAIYTHMGDSDLAGFGQAVAGAGDVNGDGRDDYMVGVPWDGSVAGQSGMVRVFSGRDGTVLFNLYGSSLNQSFGYALDGLGDLNGDGYADILVGVRGWLGVSSARVFAGPSGTPLYSVAGLAQDNFGSSLSGTGDLDGDGVNDWIVGASRENANRGSAQAFSGQTGLVLFRVDGVDPEDELGWTVAGAGDFDGDGTPDVIIGAPGRTLNGVRLGAAEIRSGSDGALLHVMYGELDGERFGDSVDGVGDVNGDGLDDSIVGARWANLDHGGARVIAGGPGCLSFNNYCSTSPNSFGAGAQMSGTGSTSVVVNDLGLLASGAIPGQSALFFMGPNQIALPFGNGVRCVGGAVKRLGIVLPDAGGVASLALDNDSVDLSGLFVPGSNWNFQLWLRDTGVGSGFNLSDGLSASICP